jgi:hypothetical protein
MKSLTPEHPIAVDKSTRVTLAEFTRLRLLSKQDHYPATALAPEPQKNVVTRVVAAMSKART